MKKVLFISSTGGHFDELMQLKPLFQKYDYHIVTEKDQSNKFLKKAYGNKISYLIYATRKNIFTYFFKFIINFFISLFLYIKIRPEYIVTTGTHTAVPICYIAKLFRF